MFNQMVLSGYQFYTDQDIENFLTVGYITKDCYDQVNKLRHPEQQNSNTKTPQQ
ncbi:hypothetical protein MOO46_07345 (plasmid) [Apilactobacillus apisilvae]|uniref:XkdX family protein n=1 Tax=Apilactobacillus apisilvae TaxID=2923364 RepID=A0ABY4PJ59_9LACO|nr:hypothetical protein [Apilactobacillus apisilvae]UQS85799.1 hypothetical protein MOO46_07345 [Apilactobacillus apisilvae]